MSNRFSIRCKAMNVAKLEFLSIYLFLACALRVNGLDNKVSLVQIHWTFKASGFALLFEVYTMLLIESEMQVSKASKLIDVYLQRIWNIFDNWISIAFKEDTITELTKIGFDEASTKKEYNYVTTLVDLDQKEYFSLRKIVIQKQFKR